ncbi:unnamed protein product [Prunus armeniaca]
MLKFSGYCLTWGGVENKARAKHFFKHSMCDDYTQQAIEVSQPPIIVACVIEDFVFMPTTGRSVHEAIICPLQSRGFRDHEWFGCVGGTETKS